MPDRALQNVRGIIWSQRVPMLEKIHIPSTEFWVCLWASQSHVLRYSYQMLKPPQKTPFDVEEQWLCFEIPLKAAAHHLISRAEPGHPAKEAHLRHLYPEPQLYSHDSHLKWRRTCKSKASPFDLLSSFSSTTDQSNVLITAAEVTMLLHLSLQPAISCEQDKETVKLPCVKEHATLFQVTNYDLRVATKLDRKHNGCI